MQKFGYILLLSISLSHICRGQEAMFFHSNFEHQIFSTPSPTAFELFMAADPSMTIDKYNSFVYEYDKLLASIEKARAKTKNDKSLLQKMFYKVHHKKLGWYENHVTLSQTLDSKKYDCLTGSALLALILHDLNYTYKILEFDFHVFVIAETEAGQVLLEATDPFNGFVTDPKQIDDRIRSNVKNEKVSDGIYKTYIRNEIDLKALAGLQYFNMAVDFYNHQEYKKASDFIKKADLLYPSERIRSTMLLFASASL